MSHYCWCLELAHFLVRLLTSAINMGTILTMCVLLSFALRQCHVFILGEATPHLSDAQSLGGG